MKYAVLKVWLLITFTFCSATVWSQVKKVSGKITDEETKPIIGVSVVIKGKNIGTQTSSTGDYIIDASQGDVLVFSHTSFTSQELTVGLSDTINVSMKAESTGLDEVVVVGYGTQRRKEFAGAAQTVNPLTTKYTPSSNIGTALQGTVPGLTVQQTTGAPGSTPYIVFRGGTDFDGSGSPLVILDGVVVPSLYGIDVNDVESIDVLKDAASTAIYGARAANGVIIVTTKKGKK